MYSYEERVKAVRLYIKYDLSVADTIRELGYPSRNMLVRWHTEYEETGELHKEFKKEPKYSTEQMKKAVDYYLEHGRSISRTIRAIGYPSRPTLSQWIDELAPGERKVSITRGAMIGLSSEIVGRPRKGSYPVRPACLPSRWAERNPITLPAGR